MSLGASSGLKVSEVDQLGDEAEALCRLELSGPGVGRCKGQSTSAPLSLNMDSNEQMQSGALYLFFFNFIYFFLSFRQLSCPATDRVIFIFPFIFVLFV